MTKNIIQVGENPRKKNVENANSGEVKDFQNTHMTVEIDEACVELIKCFESAIEQLEEIRSGDIDQEGNLYYLLHDWSRKGYDNEGYNDSLQNMWDVVARLKIEEHENPDAGKEEREREYAEMEGKDD